MLLLHNEGKNIKNCSGARPQNTKYYFQKGYSWSDVSSGAMSVRYWASGCIFDTCAPTIFPKNKYNGANIIALLNSKIGQIIMDIMSPTIHYTAGSMAKFPVWDNVLSLSVEEIVRDNIAFSKNDWDSYETSWDFKRNPLV